MSITISQFIFPCPFHTDNHKFVFYICDCFYFVDKFITTRFLDST